MNEIGLLELSNNALNMTPLFHQKLKVLHERETSISNTKLYIPSTLNMCVQKMLNHSLKFRALTSTK